MVAAERETLGIIDGIVCESDVEHGEGLLLTGCATAWAENWLVGSTLRVEQVGQTLHVTKQGRSVGGRRYTRRGPPHQTKTGARQRTADCDVTHVHVAGLVTQSVHGKGQAQTGWSETITNWPL